MLNRSFRFAIAVGAFASILVSSMPTPSFGNSSARALTFGIVPQQSASRLAAIWVPFMQHLSAETGQEIRFATATDIPAFEACLAAGAYDLAYMNPYHYTTFSETAGYRAFARQADKRLKGLLVVRKDSDVESLDDLNDVEIAFPAPAAFGASVVPRAELRKRGNRFEPRYVRSHDSVYRSVAAGLFVAGGGVLRTFGNIPDDIRDQLRVIYKTAGYTPHAFAAHSRIDAEFVRNLSDAMLSMEGDQIALLKPLGMKALEAGADADWDDVRGLGLSQAQTEIATGDGPACHSG